MTPRVPRKPPRAPHAPTEKDRTMVKVMVAGGIEQAHIAGVIGVSRPTLRKWYKSELRSGAAAANALVIAALFKKATGGDTKAAIWWTQARMGWSETQKVETTGPDGRPIEQVVTYKWAEPVAE